MSSTRTLLQGLGSLAPYRTPAHCPQLCWPVPRRQPSWPTPPGLPNKATCKLTGWLVGHPLFTVRTLGSQVKGEPTFWQTKGYPLPKSFQRQPCWSIYIIIDTGLQTLPDSKTHGGLRSERNLPPAGLEWPGFKGSFSASASPSPLPRSLRELTLSLCSNLFRHPDFRNSHRLSPNRLQVLSTYRGVTGSGAGTILSIPQNTC